MLLHQEASRPEGLAGQQGDLVVTMEDATSEHSSMFFVAEEGPTSSLQGIRAVSVTQGLVSALYTDRGSQYWPTPEAGGKVAKVNLTQGGQAMRPVGIAYRPIPLKPEGLSRAGLRYSSRAVTSRVSGWRYYRHGGG